MPDHTIPPALTIRAVRTTAVEVPMTHTLGTSRGVITRAPLLLIDLETSEGITGRSYLWSYFRQAMPAIASVLNAIEETAKNEPIAPADLWAKLSARFALIGVQGIVRMAMAGFDMAAWDALSRAAGLPLVTLLGSKPRPVRAYNSCGLGLMDREALADEAEALLARGFGAVKLRLGYPTLKEDIAAVHAVKKRVGAGVTLMVDYNQALTLAEGMERGHALDREGGIYWLEEPIRHDNFAGCRQLADALDVPIQIGENFSESGDMQAALEARACDYVMPDLERIGGVTGWQRAAALAATRGIEMSSHLYPEISAHLLAATPTCHYLEYVDWADKILRDPLRIEDGYALIPERPGNGMEWDEGAVAKYRVES
jgi:mandelate racemase